MNIAPEFDYWTAEKKYWEDIWNNLILKQQQFYNLGELRKYWPKEKGYDNEIVHLNDHLEFKNIWIPDKTILTLSGIAESRIPDEIGCYGRIRQDLRGIQIIAHYCFYEEKFIARRPDFRLMALEDHNPKHTGIIIRDPLTHSTYQGIEFICKSCEHSLARIESPLKE